MATMRTSKISLKNKAFERFSSLNSRLFWRIAAGVFLSILFIEVLLLAYSWFTERGRLLQRVDESLVTVTSILDFSNPAPDLERLLENNQITGYQYLPSTGGALTGGVLGIEPAEVSAETPSKYDSQTGSYLRYHVRNTEQNKSERLYLSVDVAWIDQYMQKYVWRILVMIMLISMFVTTACLVYLKPLLVNPLLRLNQLLVKGEKTGIQTARATSRDLQRADELGSVFRSFDHLRDDLLSAEQKNILMSDRFKQFADLGADCFWEVDRQMNFNYVAGDTQRLVSLPAEEIVGQSVEQFSSKLNNPLLNAGHIYKTLWKEGVWEGQVQASTDESAPVTVRIAGIAVRNEANEITGFRGTLVDISKESDLATKLKYQASHDSLTGLYNRREFDHQLNLSIKNYEQNDEQFALAILDLDLFKQVNDTAGHLAGDGLLKSIAKVLADSVSPQDIVSRLGGDEFAIILRSKSTQDMQATAEAIRTSIEELQFIWNSESYRVSASIGVALIDPEICNVESLLFAADSCCIEAKNQGKNQVLFYSKDDPSMNSHREEAVWISRITAALENDHFSLFRQFIVRIDEKRSAEEHFEILLRMQNLDGGFWPPNLFLPVAERNAFMPKIDRWVAENAVQWLEKQHIPVNVDYCMNINLSAASLSDAGFREFLIDLVKDNQSLNQYLCFEVTESAAMTNYDETIELLTELRENGCAVALDDFGTGFSSLAYIKDLPLDYIKIDGAFIKMINTSELDQAVVKSVAKIAKVLKIKTVAEFVDSEEALELLGELQIDYAQGFLFSKPEELENPNQDIQSRAA